MKYSIRHIPFYFIGGFLLLVLFSGCDQGLQPETPAHSPHGISGTIYFKNWPPIDSVQDLRLVAFRIYPSGNLVLEILQGNARYGDTLKPYGIDSLHFTLLLDPLPPGNYQYIAVAQKYGPNLFTDWRVVGVYHNLPDTLHTGSVFVPANTVVQGIDVAVDFLKIIPPP